MGTDVAMNLTVSVVDAPPAIVTGNAGGLTSCQWAVSLSAADVTVSGPVPVLPIVTVLVLWTVSPYWAFCCRIVLNARVALPGRALEWATLITGPALALGAASTLPITATTFVKSYPAGASYSVLVMTYSFGTTAPLAVSIGKKRNLRWSVVSNVFSASSL